MTVLTGPQVAALVRAVGFPDEHHVALVAIAKATSGWLVESRDLVADPPGYGLFGLPADAGDIRALTSDPRANAVAALARFGTSGLRGWRAYVTGAWRDHEIEAIQAVAIAASAVGAPAVPGYDPATDDIPAGPTPTYGGPGPSVTSPVTPGQPTPAAVPAGGALGAVRILGSSLEAEVGGSVVGNPTWTAGVDTVPHLALTVVDQNYALLERGVFGVGNRVQWSNLTLRLDAVSTSPGGHGTGQADLACVDDIVYGLMMLRGPRSMSGVSVYTWLASELRLIGVDPAKYLLCEATSTQTEIVRDIPDPSGESGEGQEASAWTTAVRLAKELGKRVFVSGQRLVFGSARFAMQWCAEGELRIGWRDVPAGEQWVTVPEVKRTTVASRAATLQVTGTVPHNRAPWFRPGVPVRVRATPGVPGEVLMMVAGIEHDVIPAAEGGRVVLIEPVDPPPQPPQQTQTAAATNNASASTAATGGGSYDSQASQFVAVCLQQVGDRYVFGAEAKASDPNPRVFDCSELVEWGCARCGVKPTMPDGSANQLAHCRRNGSTITVQQAINTKGALLFSPGHVAISLGNGKTVEAMNPAAGVKQGNANGRNWTAGARIPGMRY